MKRLLLYMKPFYKRMSVGLTIKVLGTLFELALPYILSVILDEVVPAAALEGNTENGIKGIVFWSGLMLLCTASALVFNITANRMASRVARDTARLIRHDLFSSTMYLSCAKTDAFTVPSLESRLTSDTYNVHHLVGMLQRLGVRAPILLIGGIVITVTLDTTLALVMLCVLPLVALTVFLVSRRGVPLYKRSQSTGDNMVRIVREDVQGIRVIKALSKKDHERRRYSKAINSLVSDETRASMTMSLSNPIINLFLNLGLVAVLAVGAVRVNGGDCQPGKIIAFIQYFTLLSNAMLSITRIFMMYTKGAASMNRICEVIDAAKVDKSGDIFVKSGDKAKESGDNNKGEIGGISFENVNFSYYKTHRNGVREKEKMNITDMSFSIKRGQTLGVIGATGSGKSTVLQLLLRFYDLPEDGGCIKIGGVDIRNMNVADIRKKVGIAMQNDFILAGTVEENIDFGRGLSHEDIVRAARAAQAEEFIENLPDKYNHAVTAKGTNLSGGQKQRLLIARALAARPEILILDDASSALDYRTDLRLRNELRNICESGDGMTSIIVAQRVSSIQYADLILVMEKGAVIGCGKHEDLLESCDIYREIYESQMGGAVLD